MTCFRVMMVVLVGEEDDAIGRAGAGLAHEACRDVSLCKHELNLKAS